MDLRALKLFTVGLLAAASAAASGTSFAQSPEPEAAAASGSAEAMLAVPAGQPVSLLLLTPLHTRHTRKNDTAQFTVHQDVVAGGRVVIPAGADVFARVTGSHRSGSLRLRPGLGLRFEVIRFPDGRRSTFPASLVSAGPYRVAAGLGPESRLEGKKGQNQDRLLSDTLLGTTGGAFALRNGWGALIGAAAGALFGFAHAHMPEWEDIDLPRGTLVEVRITADLKIPPALTRKPGLASRRLTLADVLPDLVSSRRERDEEGSLSREQPGASAGPGHTEPPDSETETDTEPLPPPIKLEVLPRPAAWKAPAEEKSSSAFTLRVDVDLTVVEVTARDASMRFLTGLRDSDFRIVEDGIAQALDHFSTDKLPLAVALVVDRSDSLQKYLTPLREAALLTLAEFKQGDQTALISFSDAVELQEGLTENHRRLARRIGTLQVEGGTNIADALYLAAEYLHRVAPERRRALILISDNHNTQEGNYAKVEVIRRLLELETVVYSVRIVSPPVTPKNDSPNLAHEFVPDIVQETGGEVVDVTQEISLTQVLATIVDSLRLRYALGYHSTNKNLDGRFRHVEVYLRPEFGERGRTYQLWHRSGYYGLRRRSDH